MFSVKQVYMFSLFDAFSNSFRFVCGINPERGSKAAKGNRCKGPVAQNKRVVALNNRLAEFCGK
jgi:hypothetical protein